MFVLSLKSFSVDKKDRKNTFVQHHTAIIFNIIANVFKRKIYIYIKHPNAIYLAQMSKTARSHGKA